MQVNLFLNHTLLCLAVGGWGLGGLALIDLDFFPKFLQKSTILCRQNNIFEIPALHTTLILTGLATI